MPRVRHAVVTEVPSEPARLKREQGRPEGYGRARAARRDRAGHTRRSTTHIHAHLKRKHL